MKIQEYIFLLVNFLASKRGASNLVYALLAVPMILIIATAIFSNFGSNLDRATWTTQANTTYDSINTQTWSGFRLGALLPYVLIAVTIVSVILGAFGLSRVMG